MANTFTYMKCILETEFYAIVAFSCSLNGFPKCLEIVDKHRRKSALLIWVHAEKFETVLYRLGETDILAVDDLHDYIDHYYGGIFLNPVVVH